MMSLLAKRPGITKNLVPSTYTLHVEIFAVKILLSSRDLRGVRAPYSNARNTRHFNFAGGQRREFIYREKYTILCSEFSDGES